MSDLWFTLGPASLGRERELLSAGATGSRLTFSFGTTEMQLARAGELRRAEAETGRPCEVIADLPGGKTRLGTFEGKPKLAVHSGMRLILRAVDTADPAEYLPVPDEAFLNGLRPGDVIVVGDGGAQFEITSRGRATVLTPGEIQQGRGLTVQNRWFTPACLTAADIARLAAIRECADIDTVALSFVSCAADLAPAKESGLRVIAKIETPIALSCLDEISRASDGLMAARGDLALTLPWVELPDAIEQIAEAAGRTGKPWYLATQIAEGSARDGFPTRAEICDLAHWRTRGCAGVLLSYETAFGLDPLAAVSHTRRILDRWLPRTDRRSANSWQ